MWCYLKLLPSQCRYVAETHLGDSRFEQCSFLNMTSAHAITQIPSRFSFIGLSGGITCYQTRFTLYCIQDAHNVPLNTPRFKFRKYVWINDLLVLFYDQSTSLLRDQKVSPFFCSKMVDGWVKVGGEEKFLVEITLERSLVFKSIKKRIRKWRTRD